MQSTSTKPVMRVAQQRGLSSLVCAIAAAWQSLPLRAMRAAQASLQALPINHTPSVFTISERSAKGPVCGSFEGSNYEDCQNIRGYAALVGNSG